MAHLLNDCALLGRRFCRRRLRQQHQPLLSVQQKQPGWLQLPAADGRASPTAAIRTGGVFWSEAQHSVQLFSCRAKAGRQQHQHRRTPILEQRLLRFCFGTAAPALHLRGS